MPKGQNMESTKYLRVPQKNETDDYTASIDLSNACREFYNTRVRNIDAFKERIASYSAKNSGQTERRKTSIDVAMEKLGSEVGALMDQDLSLMKQLLTLNDVIEDLKYQRLYSVSKDSLGTHSGDLHASDGSVSETDMYEADDDVFPNGRFQSDSALVVPAVKICGPENESIWQGSLFNSHSDATILEHKKQHSVRFIDSEMQFNGKTRRVVHGAQHSIDSGYDETEEIDQHIELTI